MQHITSPDIFFQTVNALPQSEVILLLKEELHQMKRDWMETYTGFNPDNLEYSFELQDDEYHERFTSWMTKFHSIFDCMGVHYFGKIYIYEYISYNFTNFINGIITRFVFASFPQLFL